MQDGLNHERNVSLSVCPSVKRENSDKTKETCAHILKLYHVERSCIIVFWQWLVADDRFYLKFWSENADFQSIFGRRASAVTPSEKSSVIINRKSVSTTCFPVSLIWTECVSYKPLPKGSSKIRKCKVSKIWTIICENFEAVRDRMSVSINQ